MNWIKEYLDQIDSGKIIAGNKVKKLYRKLLEEADDSSLPFYFDEKKGERPIYFIEHFCKQAERRNWKTHCTRVISKSLYPSIVWFFK